MIEQFFASLSDGLLLGFVYGLAAMGLTLIFGVMRVINLAHGPIIALGMFGVLIFSHPESVFSSEAAQATTTYAVLNTLRMHPYLALILVAVLGLLFGIVMYSVSVHRVLNASQLSSLLGTFSVNMIIIGVGTALLTTNTFAVDFSMGSVELGAITLPGTRLVAALCSLLITGGLYLFLYRTPPGKAIRAVANNRAAAELMGVASVRMLALSFGLGTMLAALSGGLIATFFPFTILSGGGYQLKSFVIVVLGGLGNPTGALLGGLILGAMEGIVPVFMPTSWVPVIEFVLFVIILLVRPSGILGAR